MKDYAAVANDYARDVVQGRILACRLVKLACQRHLDDIARQDDDDFRYRFNPARTNKVLGFMELCPHVDGDWASRGEMLKMEPFQCFAIGSPFGWERKKDGYRRFRRVYQEWPRKNAKSTTTAALGDYMFVADGEFGAQVYSGAGTEKQAWEVFRPARLMVKRTPDLRAYYGIEVNAKNMNRPEDGSKFEPVIGKPGDGASPSFSITDEYHEHATSEQYDTFLTGMGARKQPMSWVITTAGYDTSSPCYQLHDECVAMLEGKVEDDELFALIYTIDEDDDWTSEEALRKANPSFDVAVSGDYLRSQQRRAINNPREQAVFKTKHMNVWVTAASPFFNREKWDRLGDEKLSPEQFESDPCYMAMDLASKRDLTAVVRVFRREVDGQDHLYAFLRAYCPQSRVEAPERRTYDGWVKSGYLITTPGNIVDYDYIEEDIKEDARNFRVEAVGFDKWDATQTVTHLMDFGVNMVEIPQTVDHLSDPMKWLDALIEDGRIHHDGNQLFAWSIGNVTAQVDRNDNVFPRKERPEHKIDPALALIMGVKLAMGEAGASVYEERGPLVF